jgi:hypothetical protein
VRGEGERQGGEGRGGEGRGVRGVRGSGGEGGCDGRRVSRATWSCTYSCTVTLQRRVRDKRTRCSHAHRAAPLRGREAGGGGQQVDAATHAKLRFCVFKDAGGSAAPRVRPKSWQEAAAGGATAMATARGGCGQSARARGQRAVPCVGGCRSGGGRRCCSGGGVWRGGGGSRCASCRRRSAGVGCGGNSSCRGGKCASCGRGRCGG